MRYSTIHISDTELDALTLAVRNGSYIPRSRQHKITTLIALARRDWVTLDRSTRVTRTGRRITSIIGATITHAGRIAHQQFTARRTAEADRDARLAAVLAPTAPAKTTAAAPSPRISHADPFALLGGPSATDKLLDALLPG